MGLGHVVAAASGAAGGAVIVSPLAFLASRAFGKGNKSAEGRSTTSSAGGGAKAYETKRAVDEYVQFHFGHPKDVLPYPHGPQEALNFPARCAVLCERFCEANKDFTGERGGTLALDVGCAVGGATFELTRAFTDCLGIDYSHAFIEAAQDMKRSGFREYAATVEGEITQHCVGSVAHDIDCSQARFMQGDACNLPADLPKFHAVLAANLLCRLPNPLLFLDRLPSLVRPGGVAVLVSPYSWLESWTPKNKWLGGYKTKDGKQVETAHALDEEMTKRGFTLVHQEDMPFLIQEHRRKFQLGFSHATVWQRNA